MIVIFTDLDGTLLNRDYSFDKAKPALKLVKQRKIPLIFCTSKTTAESQLYLRKLRIKAPFIVENGSAILITKGYFKFKFKYNEIIGNNYVIRLGAKYTTLVNTLKQIAKKTNSEIVSFNDMSVKDVAKACDLTVKEAKLSKKRDYIEPFKLIKGNINKIIKEIKRKGLNYTRSSHFNYIMGKSDKGKAVKILSKLLEKKYGKIITAGIGDNVNDLPMLNAVDKAFLVKTYNGKYIPISSKKIIKAGGKGPEGWRKAVLSLLNA